MFTLRCQPSSLTRRVISNVLKHEKDAKLILNDLKKQRPFNLKTIDIQSEGQEKWKRRYVYTIPVLHLEGKMIAQGRWDTESVRTAILGWKSIEQDSSTEADAE